MNIVMPKYILQYKISPFRIANNGLEDAKDMGFIFDAKKELDPGEEQYVIFWGVKNSAADFFTRYGVMEAGFFSGGAFIDTVGNYQTSSLNTKDAYKLVESFDLAGRKSAKDIITNLPPNNRSKYSQTVESHLPTEWSGPVLASQIPRDRSIRAVTTPSKYMEFVENCCKYYGKNLFVKLHPLSRGELYNTFIDMAKKYNCTVGKADVSIIDNCEFVISYNSTFAVDCLLRNKPYVQYGLGTFYNAYGVIYSAGTFPHSVENKEDGQQLCNFLIHKYCFNKITMSREKYANMVKHYSTSKDLFPMTDEFSYASECI